MKPLVIVLFVFPAVVLAAIAFFLGTQSNKNKTRLIYVPIKISSSAPLLNVKGSYTFNTTGVVKTISENTIVITNGENEATFNLKNDTTVLAPNTDSTSSGSVKVDIFKPQKEVPLVSVKTGQSVILQILISNNNISVKTLNVTSNGK